MGWIAHESFRFFCPAFSDEFVGREPFEHLESAREIVSLDEVSEVLSKLFEIIVVEASDCSFLDGSIHPLDLPVGPGMVGLGKAMLDIMVAKDIAECVSHVTRCWPVAVLG